MDFSVDIEKVLNQKNMPLKHLLLIVIFLFFLAFAIISGIDDGNFCAVIASMITGLICLSFSKEIRKIHEHNHLITFQRNLVTNGFDASLFAFFVFSENGKCIFVNRLAQNLFPGFKIRTIEDFILCFGKYPKIVEAIRNLQISAENRKQSHIDIPMNLSSDGNSLWRVAVSPLPEHKGYTGWSIIDLTPSTNRMESPETNSNFLLEILNNSNVGYVCVNENNEIIFCNNTLSQWIGCEIENILHNELSKFITQNKNDTFQTVTSMAKVSGELPIKVILNSDANPKINVQMRKIFSYKDGSIAYILTKDTQQSNEFVQALEKTQIYFEHIFEDAPVGIIITDGAEIIHSANKAFRAIIGTNDIENKSLLSYLSEEEKHNVSEKLYQSIDGIHKTIAPFEIQFQSKTMSVYITKIDESKRNKDNDGLVIYFVDITDRKDLQQQFVQSQKMQAVGQLAGGIAHDFNNLLTAMIGYCDLLLEKHIPSDQSFNDVMQIKQNANRASNLVRQLLAFSRQQTLQPKTLNVTDIISDLSSLLKRLLGAKITLKVIHGRDLGFVKVDQIQFEQVIINLAVNARDAMSNGGTLTIQTSQYFTKESQFMRGATMPIGKYVLIEVIDTGCGIENSQLNRIFDPFFSTKEKGHGTGLGLSTVYGIVNQTGGFISVDSEIGVGTTFKLYFPMFEGQEVELDDAKDSSTPKHNVDLTGGGTILLVEDEDAVRMFGSRALRDKGYRVIEAQNGESALEYIKKSSESIDLIITDVVMPKMDGPTLISHIQDYNPNIKIIFISGYTEDNFRESLANNNKVHFLPKPFNLKDLALKVKEVMSN